MYTAIIASVELAVLDDSVRDVENCAMAEFVFPKYWRIRQPTKPLSSQDSPCKQKELNDRSTASSK